MSIDEMELIKKVEYEAPPEAAPDFGVESETGKGLENKPEVMPEQEAPGAFAGIPVPLSAPQPTAKDPVVASVENILEENLADLYINLSPQEQARFKAKGEETTKKIVELLRSAKATFKKIFNLIFGWLKIIPGINKFFMEQEAKIKADKIIKLH
ncbi:MAG: hypothetical protein PHT40_00580 [Patescibacteria group bacterium]|nr:hypothetical protein [Patescibacteria group bacterium]